MAQRSLRGLQDERTRVTFFLPARVAAEVRAVRDVVDHLQEQKKGPVPLTGFTCSDIQPSVFTGYWRPRTRWHEEPVVSFIIDYGIRMNETQQLNQVLQQLERDIKKIYADNKRPQRVIWIMAQRALRYD